MLSQVNQGLDASQLPTLGFLFTHYVMHQILITDMVLLITALKCFISKLKNYEEEIKTYGVERNEIIGKQKQLEDENGKVK